MTFNYAKELTGQHVREAKEAAGLTWSQIAEQVDQPREWLISALLGNHPVPEQVAVTVGEILSLDDEDVRVLMRQPYRGGLGELAQDPTVYRFVEALAVYGSAIKEAIHEDFGDGIMSAIDFDVSVSKRDHPGGERIVVTFDGKYLTYPER